MMKLTGKAVAIICFFGLGYSLYLQPKMINTKNIKRSFLIDDILRNKVCRLHGIELPIYCAANSNVSIFSIYLYIYEYFLYMYVLVM